MTDIKSIMSKIALDDVLTPYEAIQLQYMNMRQVRNRIPDVESASNLYFLADEIHSIYSPIQLKQLLSFSTLRDAQEYDAYKWAADLLMKYDNNSEIIKDKCIAILNELRYFRDEYLIKLLIKENSVKLELLEEFIAYSQTYQKKVSFRELLNSYTLIIKTLFTIIDNVLILNYFLSGMVEIPDLICLANIKKIFTTEKNDAHMDDELVTPFELKAATLKSIIDIVIHNNHINFVLYMGAQLESFSWKLSPRFNDESMAYSRNIMKEVVDNFEL